MSLKARVEAVLFITARAVEVKEIAEILGEEENIIEEALLELMFDYSAREGALEIDDTDGYILQVKLDHMDIVEKLCPVELKAPVLKTLSVIALKEPIRQTELKDLRGSTAYEHVAAEDKLRVFTFGNTRLLSHSVSLEELRKIAAEDTKKDLQLQGPNRISSDMSRKILNVSAEA